MDSRQTFRLLFPDDALVGRPDAMVANEYVHRPQAALRFPNGLFTALDRAQICGDIFVAGCSQVVGGSRHAHYPRATRGQQICSSKPNAAAAARYQRNSSFNATCHRVYPPTASHSLADRSKTGLIHRVYWLGKIES